MVWVCLGLVFCLGFFVCLGSFPCFFFFSISLVVLKNILLFSMLVKHAELTDIKLGKELVNILYDSKHL